MLYLPLKWSCTAFIIAELEGHAGILPWNLVVIGAELIEEHPQAERVSPKKRIKRVNRCHFRTVNIVVFLLYRMDKENLNTREFPANSFRLEVLSARRPIIVNRCRERFTIR